MSTQEQLNVPTVEPQILIETQPEETPPGPDNQQRPSSPARAVDLPRRVTTRDLCRLARQLSTLLHAGMPLVPALSALAEQMQCPPKHQGIRWGQAADPLAQIVVCVRDDVNAGTSLADALARHPALFSPLFINMIAAGQASGTLEVVLARLADILEKRVRLAGKVKSAVAYPAMMAAVAVGVVTFLLSVVVPSITELFLKMNQELPWPTTLLINISSFVRNHAVLLLIAVCGSIAALIAQGLPSYDAAVLGTYLHGMAGDLAAEKYGQVSMMATDILEWLPNAFERHRARTELAGM